MTVRAGDMRTDERPHSRTSRPRSKARPLDLLGMLGRVELHADHEALAADVADEVADSAPPASRDRRSPGSPRSARVLDQATLEQVDRGQRRRAGDGIAAVGRAVVRRPPTLEDLGARDQARRAACPEAMPLAVSRMSGSTPQWSTAHILPVRPAPDWISSATSRMPCWSQMRAKALRGSRPPGRCSRPRPGSARR